MIMKEYEQYIIGLLSDNVPELAYRIAYLRVDEPIPQNKDIIIYKSDFFEDGVYGTQKSMPQLPLHMLKGIPILYGQPLIEKKGEKYYIYADLVASSYFLISRYEEIINKERDEFGRFQGTKSLLCRAGSLHRPIIDEYSRLLHEIAHIPNTREEHRVCLTHDIDIPYSHFTCYSAVKKTLGDIVRKKPITTFQYFNLLGNPKKDPKYIFDRFIEFDSKVSGNDVIYFAKSGGTIKPYDDYNYINDKSWKRLSEKLLQSGAEIGYHSSFEAAENPDLLHQELHLLEKIQQMKITKHRSHYLRSMEPESFLHLINVGITDDYTMGFADVAGFRLGTARIVSWINPLNKEVTKLNLHPMIAMDGTLVGKNYMGLSKEEAIAYLKMLIDASTYGNPSVIWHNHIVCEVPELDDIYFWLVDYLQCLREN